MNIVILQGRLTADPEVRTLNSGKTLAEFSLAVRRPKSKDESDFFRCVAWENTGEFITEYFGKGDGIIIKGYARQETWQDTEGKSREAVRFVVQDVEFPASKVSGTGNSASAGGEDSKTPAKSGETKSAAAALGALKGGTQKTVADQDLLDAVNQLPV